MRRRRQHVIDALQTQDAGSGSDSSTPPKTDGGGADVSTGADTSTTPDTITSATVRCTQAEFDDAAGDGGGDFTTFGGVDISFPTSAAPAQYSNHGAKVKLGASITFAGKFASHPLASQGGDTPSPIPPTNTDPVGRDYHLLRHESRHVRLRVRAPSGGDVRGDPGRPMMRWLVTVGAVGIVGCGAAVGQGKGARGARAGAETRVATDVGESRRRGLSLLETGRPDDAIALLDRSCKQGDGPACMALGAMLYEGIGTLPEEARALGVFEEECKRGKSGACILAGAVHHNGRGVARDDARARERFERACTDGERLGCVLAAVMREPDGSPISARDVEHASALCDLDVPAACGLVALVHTRGGAGITPDPGKARAAWERACSVGSPAACAYVGAELGSSSDPTQQARGAMLIGKGCAMTFGPACTVMGVAYRRGAFGLTADAGAAEQMFERACTHSDPEGCALLGVTVAPRDLDRARALLGKTCREGYADGCAKLAAVLFESDRKGARDAAARACNLGHALGCQLLDTIGR